MDYLALVVVLAVVAVVVFAVLGFQKMFGGVSDWFGQFKLPEFTFPEITFPDFSGIGETITNIFEGAGETFNYLFVEGGGPPSIIPSPPPSKGQIEYIKGGGEPIYVGPLWTGPQPYKSGQPASARELAEATKPKGKGIWGFIPTKELIAWQHRSLDEKLLVMPADEILYQIVGDDLTDVEVRQRMAQMPSFKGKVFLR